MTLTRSAANQKVAQPERTRGKSGRGLKGTALLLKGPRCSYSLSSLRLSHPRPLPTVPAGMPDGRRTP